MRYGIPNYRLPDSVLDDFQYRHLELKGIKVRPNTTIGKTITIDDLFRDGYKSVFIGAGLWKANAMHIKGESLGNVAFGIDYLANSKAFRLGDDVAVIGVGNSAMDCARTAIRNGARHVTCYARRDESCISASEYEVSYAKLEGVGFRFCKAPVEIRENGLICRDTVKGEDGKFTQVEGSEMFYPHTGVIVSVSQGAENELVQSTTGIQTNQRGLLTVKEDGSTTPRGRVCRRRRRDGCPHRRRGRGYRQKGGRVHGQLYEVPAQRSRPGPLCGHSGFQHSHLGRADQAGRLNPIKFHEPAVEFRGRLFL